MQDFTDFVDLVAAMIKDFGTTGVLTTQPDNGVYDPVKGLANPVSSDIMLQCIIMDKTLTYNGAGVMEKRLIQEADKILYVSPTALLIPVLMPDGVLRVTASSDRVTVGGYEFGIVRVKVIDLSGDGTSPILFELYLRR